MCTSLAQNEDDLKPEMTSNIETTSKKMRPTKITSQKGIKKTSKVKMTSKMMKTSQIKTSSKTKITSKLRTALKGHLKGKIQMTFNLGRSKK